jgi:hypothetical protein
VSIWILDKRALAEGGASPAEVEAAAETARRDAGALARLKHPAIVKVRAFAGRLLLCRLHDPVRGAHSAYGAPLRMPKWSLASLTWGDIGVHSRTLLGCTAKHLLHGCSLEGRPREPDVTGRPRMPLLVILRQSPATGADGSGMQKLLLLVVVG